MVLADLLVVLGGSVSGGRNLGLMLAFAAFILIDLFFQLPYGEITVSKPLDWVILFSFLITSLVATQLLAVARSQTAAAQRQAAEVATLSAERERLTAEAEHAKALHEADRLKDIVLASLSHDLRTPLTTIKALAQDSALRGDANATVIEEQADRLSRFVSDLLDLSRLKGGVLPVTPELNTAEDLIGAATRQVAGLLRGRRVVTRIPLGGAAASTVYDAASGCVLVSVPDRNELIAIDPGTATVSGAFVLADGDRPGVLALDAADRLMFIAHSGRATMTVVSLRSTEVVDVAPTGTSARDMAFATTWHRLYLITDNGHLSGYDLRRSRLFLTGVLDDIVASGVAVDPHSHTVYLATKNAERRSSRHILEGVAPKAPRCVFHHATAGSPCFARYAPTR